MIKGPIYVRDQGDDLYEVQCEILGARVNRGEMNALDKRHANPDRFSSVIK